MKKTFLYILIMVITATVFGQNVYVVTKTTDPNPFYDKFNNDDALCDPDMYGTLQWAINKVNYNGGESRIEFNIPGTGVHEISSNSYFPQIKNPVVIDGTTQAGYTTGNPVVKITGQMKTQYGFNVYNTTVTIKGLHISNFANSAILLTNCSHSKIIDNKICNIASSGNGLQIFASNYTEIYGNRIEIDALPSYGRSLFGIYIDKSEYCIVGSTEQGKANTIANCYKAGVYINGYKFNKVSGNIIYNNPAAILLGSNANGNIQPPVITSYTNGILSGTALPNSTVEVFGSTGAENANEYFMSTFANSDGQWEVNISVDFDYLIATQTSTTLNTSQLSTPIFTGGSTSGISCQDAVLIKAGNYPRPILSNMQTTEKWFRFIPDSLDYIISVEELLLDTIHNISSISLFKNSCENPEEIYISGISDSLVIYASNLIVGDQYFIRVIAQEETDEFFRLFCFHETKEEFNCTTDCINLIANSEFTYHDPITDNSPFVSDVYCWHRGWGTPQIFSLPTDHARMHAYKFNSTYYSESIYTNVDILNGEEYELKFDFAEWKPETNSPSLKKFYIVLTSASDPFSSYNDGAAGVITHMPNNPQIFQIYDDNPTTTNVTENFITTDWQNKSITFTANRDYDLMYIYPESDLGEDYAAWLKIDNLSLSITNQELIVANSIVLCNDVNSYTINPPTQLSGTWFSETNDITESGVITPTDLSVGVHNFYYFTDDCSKKYQIPVIIRDLPEINSFNPTEFCINANFQQVIANPSGGTFSGTGISTNGFFSPSLAGLGDHTILYTYNDGFCTNTELFLIEVNNIPDQPVISATNNGYGCPGGTVVLTVTEPVGSGFSYIWNGPGLPANTIGISATITNFANNSIGFYSVVVTDNNSCSNSSQVQIKMFPEFVINPGPDGDCEGENTVYIATPEGFSSVITVTNLISTFTYFTGTYAYQPGGNTINIPYLAPGDYRIRHHFTTNGTDIFCPTTQDVLIRPNPSAEISGIESLCGAEANLLASGGTTYLWSNGDTESEATVYTSGTYYVTVFDDFNCSDVADFTIELINEAAEIEVIYFDNDPCSHQVQFRISPGGDFDATITNINTGTIVSGSSGWYGVSPTYLYPLNHPYNLPPGNYYLDLYSLNTDCEYHHYFNIPTVCPDLISKPNPGTCFNPYNGSVQVTISNGIPPYQVLIVQGSNIVSNTYTFDESGTYTINFNSNFNPELPYDISLTNADPFGANYYFNQNAIGYAWPTENMLTSENISDQTLYSDNIYYIGTSIYPGLYIRENVTFSNCQIYTNVWGTNDTYNTRWRIIYEDDVNTPEVRLLNGTIVQSGCPDKMWQGIEAAGEYTTQFYVETMDIEINQSNIADAMCAVKLSGKAHITAIGSNFENNMIDIYINQVGTEYINNTNIKNNNFTTTGLLNNPSVFPSTHVLLKFAKDITFSNNHFTNTNDFDPWLTDDQHYYANMKGKGIEAVFSSFTVTPVIQSTLPLTPFNRNYFHGLYYAIDAQGQKTYAPKIHHCEFTNNYRAIHLKATNGARVLYNKIYTTEDNLTVDAVPHVNNGTPQENVTYATYLNGAKNTWFEENKIFNGMAGAYIYNSDDNGGTRYYRNDFGGEIVSNNVINNKGMNAASIVVGKNSNWNTINPPVYITGLEVRCNDYTGNDYAISVLNGNMRKDQGVYQGQTNQLAGNQFHTTMVNGKEFKVQIAHGSTSSTNFSQYDLGIYNYYQHDDNNDDQIFHRELNPARIIGVDNRTSYGLYFIETDACPPHFSLNIFDHRTAISDISVRKNSLAGLQTQYDDVVDNGNTEYMLSLAENLSPHNFKLYVPQLSNDGYISDTVFSTLLKNTTAQKPVIASVLIANSPLPTEIMAKVENSTYLSNGHKNQIRAYQEGINNRVLLEKEISGVQQEIFNIEGELVNNVINNDSISEAVAEVINYFYSKPSLVKSDYVQLFTLQNSIGNFAEASSTLNNLRSYASTLNPVEADEIYRYCDVNEIYLTFIDSVSDLSVLMNNKQFLLESALASSADYSAMAEVLYSFTTDSIFLEYTPLPTEIMAPRNTVINENLDENEALSYNVYPVPAKDMIFVEYNFEENYSEATELLNETMGKVKDENCNFGIIKLYSTDGKLINTYAMSSVSGRETISISELKPGNYMLEIEDCFGNTRSSKITKF